MVELRTRRTGLERWCRMDCSRREVSCQCVGIVRHARQRGGIIIPQGTPEHPLGPWRYALPVLMLLVAGVMVSNVRYPTFKQVEWTARKSVAAFAGVVVAAMLFFNYPQVTFAFLFVTYLIYGLVRPWVRKSWRREIEEDGADETDVA